MRIGRLFVTRYANGPITVTKGKMFYLRMPTVMTSWVGESFSNQANKARCTC